MRRVPVASLHYTLLVGFMSVAACTTGTDVPESMNEEQARLDRIALITHRMLDDARAHPAKPASALVVDLNRILQEAEPAP